MAIIVVTIGGLFAALFLGGTIFPEMFQESSLSCPTGAIDCAVLSESNCERLIELYNGTCDCVSINETTTPATAECSAYEVVYVGISSSVQLTVVGEVVIVILFLVCWICSICFL